MRTRLLDRITGAVIGVLALLLVAALAGIVRAGPLDPPGPVGSTMRPLDELLPSWSRQIPSDTSCNSPRFTCVLPDAAHATGAGVLDHETGLVWERVPTASANTWVNQQFHCTIQLLGGRQGWRLPSVDELASLLDADSAGPFDLGAAEPVFWSVSQTPSEPTSGRFSVTFSGVGGPIQDSIAFLRRAWCVRGGTSHASY